ncbi:UNVERIFIED_CONTAM: hypothetical protein GTU68_009713 [Idotea baltica]|nr:hypothetical protein [Idotea baltica]
MIQRVWEQAQKSAATRVVIATDDERIMQVAHTFGAESLMTSSDHPSGTDRLQEVVAALNLPDEHIVVNVQGDEPLIPPAVIDQVAANLAAVANASIATLSEPIESIDELLNPNAVKVVTDRSGLALYFSRAAIPWPRDHFASHIGIYAYKVQFLHQYVRWQPSPIELAEQLEQLRALHHGVRIHVAKACELVPAGVDTQSDLDKVVALVSGQGATC